MKRKLLFSIALTALFFVSHSCQNEESMDVAQESVRKYSPIEIYTRGQGEPIFYTNVTESLNKFSNTPFTRSISSNPTYRTYEFFMTDRQVSYIYTASLLKGESIATGKFIPLLNEVDPITINIYSPSFWISKDIQKAKLSSFRVAVADGLNEALGAKNVASSFVIDMNQFTYYDELKLAFGSDVDVKSILGFPSGEGGKIKSKTGLILRFIKRNFSAEMNFPRDGNLLLNNNDIWNLNQYSPVYINTVTYGSAGFLVIESDNNYEDVRDAVNTALGSIITSGKMQISNLQEQILNRSRSYTLLIGENGASQSSNLGISSFAEAVINNGTFSRDNWGVPIIYTARKLSDNSPYYNTYTIKME